MRDDGRGARGQQKRSQMDIIWNACERGRTLRSVQSFATAHWQWDL